MGVDWITCAFRSLLLSIVQLVESNCNTLARSSCRVLLPSLADASRTSGAALREAVSFSSTAAAVSGDTPSPLLGATARESPEVRTLRSGNDRTES